MIWKIWIRLHLLQCKWSEEIIILELRLIISNYRPWVSCHSIEKQNKNFSVVFTLWSSWCRQQCIFFFFSLANSMLTIHFISFSFSHNLTKDNWPVHNVLTWISVQMQPYICVNDICLFDKSCQSFMWLTFYDNRFGIYFYGQINTGHIVNRHIHFNIRIIMKYKNQRQHQLYRYN